MHAQRVVGLQQGRCPAAKVEAVYAAEAAAGAAVVEGRRAKHFADLQAHARGQRGQERFGKVAGPFLAFLMDVFDYNDFRYVCKKQMGLDKHHPDPYPCPLVCSEFPLPTGQVWHSWFLHRAGWGRLCQRWVWNVPSSARKPVYTRLNWDVSF